MYLHFSVTVFVSLAFYFCFATCEIDENHQEINKMLLRNSRTCKHRPYSPFEPFYRHSIFENTFYLIFIVVLGIIFGLMFLGCLKGLMGTFGSKKIGEYGMDALIDLPKPLDRYRETNLKGREVCYDVVGWPVHPDTGERTVRMLPLKVEFCLNIIFFLAYPLAIILKICSVCCCIRDFKGEEDKCFKEIHVIKCKSKKSSGPEIDMYKENDLREARDTSYVINALRDSQKSLEQLNKNNIKECRCKPPK
ncbi:uncharacterized protein LOC126739638 [Anthonomus grandis grandis]|uniref:uncharacterized protein LOC126739638 n=1 Tax=Anthonomus grandis grandis TaxID=2921223 RepID=UPI002165895E|nr:uncharacterized protein LOC126739638 [Anthonomus grandis grandis]